MTVIADEIAITLNHHTVSSFEYNYDRYLVFASAFILLKAKKLLLK